MNNRVRKYLIEKSISYEPVYYENVVKDCDLQLNLDSENDRKKLSAILGEVSAYEYANHRPLLSAVAIYKNKLDHGYGFYEVAHKLLKKNKQELIDEAFGFVELKNCREYWSDPENLKDYYETSDTDVEAVKHPVPFYEIADIEFLHTWGGHTYDKTNEEHIAAKEYIMATCGKKVKYWSNCLIKRLPQFETYNPSIWSQKGWDKSSGVNQTVTKFKHYSWARIFKKGDIDRDIFFTVEANGKEQALVYKLDYYFEGVSNLNKEQQEILNANIPKEIRWLTISYEELKMMNWDSLLDITTKFIAKHTDIYDRLITMAWGEKSVSEIFRDHLVYQEPELNKLQKLPILNPTFKGYESDYIAEARRNKDLGDAGEGLVIKYEQKKLRTLNLHELADKVKKVKDGNGYDILSFDEDENPFYIEVKCTEGNCDTPFYMSINEKIFAERNSEKYFIYRIYNYNETENTGSFFIIKDVNVSLLFQPITFKVYNKII
jgi:hypothetical protein